MKRFRLFAAAVLLVSGATAHADPFVRTAAADPESAPSPSDVVPVIAVAYQDYPPYPPGFSSYRGLGFMGFCCEPVSPCALNAWAGYCDEKACCESEHHPSFCEKLHAWLCQPAWICCSQTCVPCTGGCSPVPPSDWPAKLPRLRGQRACILGGCHAGSGPYGKGSQPAKTETPDGAVETLPEPPASDPATSETTGEITPNLPSPSTSERSASRADLRRLPTVEGNY
jgi:hypothetical protein